MPVNTLHSGRVDENLFTLMMHQFKMLSMNRRLPSSIRFKLTLDVDNVRFMKFVVNETIGICQLINGYNDTLNITAFYFLRIILYQVHHCSIFTEESISLSSFFCMLLVNPSTVH